MSKTFYRLERWLLIQLLNRHMLALRAEGKEAAEDATLDVMDSVSGWCSPRWRRS